MSKLNVSTATFILLVFLMMGMPHLVEIYSNLFTERSFSVLDVLYILPSCLLAMSLFAASLLALRRSKALFTFLFLLASIGSLIDTGCVRILGTSFQLDHAKAIAASTRTEAIEFSSLSGKFIPLILITLTAAVTAFVMVLRRKEHELPERKNLLMASAVLLILGVISTEVLTSIFLGNSDKSRNPTRIALTLHRSPFNFWSKWYDFSRYKAETRMLIERRKGHVTDSRLKDGKVTETVVLVIGERLRYSNWSINGYWRNTSPGLAGVDGLTSLALNFSNGNSTATSIPYLMSGVNPLRGENPFDRKSILGIFKEAGYETHWITNAPIDFMEVSNEAEHLNSLIPQDIDDTAVISPFKQAISGEGRRFILVNLRGPHALHLKRHFSADENVTSMDKLTNKYDDMILNTDKILTDMIRALDSSGKSCYMIVVSDHGTNLFDDNSSNLYGYGSKIPTEKEIHTPLFVWQSKRFEKDFPSKMSNFKNNLGKPSSNACVFETLVDAGNIAYRQQDSGRSLLSSGYRTFDTLGVMSQGTLVKFLLKDRKITRL
jgi:glucan phosphoethanolaminetransferase (alkaline phosphatase superfamily)